VITETQQKLTEFVKKIHSHQWRGVTGKPIEHIVNIGIGGSYTGPMMCTEALREYAVSSLKFHFISSVDKVQLNDVILRINPETTLFIISSKSFSTIETLTNAETIVAWMKNKLGTDVLRHHFIAVTAAADKALRFGIQPDCIFPLWDWVGGRYSVWSAIGLPLMLMLGHERFDEFLEGAYAMDQHFRHAPFSENMPVLLALLGIWYNNFFSANVQAIVPYAHRLRYFIPYLQQAEMESNGKRVSQHGEDLTYATGPVIFGEEGVIGQHAYHQLLHQGQHLIPVDFILTSVDASLSNPHDDILLASALSQANALMRGKTYEEAQTELMANGHSAAKAAELARHQIIPGNKPSNLICMHHLTPRSLGALLALYEHKIFVQGAIWDINSFDQWGVELGKQLLPAILRHINGTARDEHIDTATADLIQYLERQS
jgi:glucose-6-phosphate isomerase